MKTVTEQLAEAQAEIATLKGANEEMKTELATAKQEAATSKQEAEVAKTELATAKADLATAKDATAKADQKAIDEGKRADTEKARADVAEAKLALDPRYLRAGGRKEGVEDGVSNEGGAALLAKYNAITDRKEKRKFYEANKAALLAASKGE